MRTHFPGHRAPTRRVPAPRALPRLHAVALAAGLAALAASPAARAVTYTWATGDFTPGFTAPSPLLAPDALQIVAGVGPAKRVGLNFDNQATVQWLADPVQGFSGAVIGNAGLWDVQSDAATFQWIFGNQPSFVNTGTFQKSAGALTSLGNFKFVNNGGLLRVTSGVLSFNGGGPEFNTGSRFSGPGLTRIDTASAFNGSLRSDNLALGSGTFTGTAARLDGGVAGPGLIRWTGGDLVGDWTISQNRQLQGLDGTLFAKRLGGSLTVNGTLGWDTADRLQGFSGANLRVFGLLDLRSSATTQWVFGNQPTVTVGSAAVVATRAGVNFQSGNFRWNSNGGQFDAEAGGAFVFNGGSARFGNGTRFTGAGLHTIASAATLTGTITSENLVLSGGTITGGTTGTTRATLRGTTTWTGGDLAGRWTLAPDQQVVGTVGGGKRLVGSNVNNRGLMQWDTVDDLQGANAALWRNDSRFEALQSARLLWVFGGQPTFLNTATGVVQAKTGVTWRAGNWIHVGEGGLYTADAGGTILFDSASNTFREGTRFFGAGVNRITGGARIEAGIRSGNLEIAGGTVTGGDGLPGGLRARPQGTVNWTGGDLSGAWTLPAGQTINGQPGLGKRLVGVDLVNEGTLLWQTADPLQGGNAGTLRNVGVFEARQSAGLSWVFGGQPTLVNAATGVVRAAAGAALSLGNFVLDSEGGVFNAFTGSRIDYGGSVTMRANTRYTGAGLVRAVGNARYLGAQVSSNLQFVGGTQTGGDGTAGSTGNLRGTTTWLGSDLAGAWQVDAGQTLRGAAGTGKRLVGGTTRNLGTLDWATGEALQLGNGAVLENDGTVLMQGDAAVQWVFGTQGVVVNNGVWRKTAGAGQSGMGNVLLTNNGVMQVDSGSIGLPGGFSNGGTLAGRGSFASGTLTNLGVVSPGDFNAALSAVASPFTRHASIESSTSTATLTVAGNYVQPAGGVLDIQLTSATQADQLVVTGNATVGGTLNVSCLGTCSFAAGQQVAVLDAGGSLSGSFGAVNLLGLPPGSFSVSYDRGTGRVLLTANQPIALSAPARR